jgi:MFS family permease
MKTKQPLHRLRIHGSSLYATIRTRTRKRLHLTWSQLHRRAARITAGGYWSDRVTPNVRRNLRWFWFSGVFGQASESIVATYLTLYVLALGASAGQIGLMSSLSNLSAALLALPGALNVERWGQRKRICVWSGGGFGRGVLLLLALLPMVATGHTVIYYAIVLILIRSAFANLAVPAWTSLTADIVPIQWRGRYFSSRNIAMGVAGMVTIYLIGQLITRLGPPAGYQVAIGLAFAIGLISTASFRRIQEPEVVVRPRVGSSPRLPLLKNIQQRPEFLMLCAAAGLWNLALNIAGPFFSVHFVTGLKGSASFWGLVSVAHGLAALPGQRIFGVLSDRWGPRRVQLLTGLTIPLVPWLWAVSSSPWHLVPIELLSGFLWAGYGLASFNFLLTLTPEDRRARYTAFYHIVVTLALAAGAAIGGGVSTWFGYKTTFALSGIGRLVAAVLFAVYVRAPSSDPA